VRNREGTGIEKEAGWNLEAAANFARAYVACERGQGMEKQFRVPQVKNSQAPISAGSYAQAIMEKIREMESALEAGQDLVVYCHADGGALRVDRLQFTDSALIVVHGYSEDRSATYFISTSYALELTCKVMSAGEGAGSEQRFAPIIFELPETNAEARAAGAAG
jgi:hypothetical protein